MDKDNESYLGEKEGAVTLIDILGWKGIWQRKENAISELLSLIEYAEERKSFINSLTKDDNNEIMFKFKELKIEVKSISDTIAIITYGDVNLSLEFHSIISSRLIYDSIIKGIPVRGATSYGKFTIKENIMVGPAIDEVAAWYEQANWIGVYLTPSAYFKVNRDEFVTKEFSNFLIEYEVPTKKWGKVKTFCVNWPQYPIIRLLDKEKCKKELKESFLKSAPILPEVYQKYVNTLDFYDKVIEEDEHVKNYMELK